MANAGVNGLMPGDLSPVSPNMLHIKANNWLSFSLSTCISFSSPVGSFLYELITLLFLGLKLKRTRKASL